MRNTSAVPLTLSLISPRAKFMITRSMFALRSNADYPEALQLARIKPRHLVRGDSLFFGSDVHADIFYPTPDLKITAAG
jgi:hypothetical protein